MKSRRDCKNQGWRWKIKIGAKSMESRKGLAPKLKSKVAPNNNKERQ